MTPPGLSRQQGRVWRALERTADPLGQCAPHLVWAALLGTGLDLPILLEALRELNTQGHIEIRTCDMGYYLFSVCAISQRAMAKVGLRKPGQEVPT